MEKTMAKNMECKRIFKAKNPFPSRKSFWDGSKAAPKEAEGTMKKTVGMVSKTVFEKVKAEAKTALEKPAGKKGVKTERRKLT
jgi:hypothetical protein